jgi:butyrate kinase
MKPDTYYHKLSLTLYDGKLEAQKAKINKDIAAYLDRGGNITQIPRGTTSVTLEALSTVKMKQAKQKRFGEEDER